jgi:hypothetical protein
LRQGFISDETLILLGNTQKKIGLWRIILGLLKQRFKGKWDVKGEEE